MFDKKITLYFAKKDDLCVLYDYERTDSKEEVQMKNIDDINKKSLDNPLQRKKKVNLSILNLKIKIILNLIKQLR